MRILLANDDGIACRGILDLAKELSLNHEVYIVAPDGERSSYSHSVTYWRLENQVEEVHIPYVKKAWKTSGTPADCVYYAINAFMKDCLPDIVITGINRGENLSTDVLYSGTVGAALEGLMMGIPSMATSLCNFEATDFSTAAKVVSMLIPHFMTDKNNLRYVLNVNVPDIAYDALKGMRVTHFCGMKDFRKTVEMHQNDNKIILTCQNTIPPIIDYEKRLSADIEAVKQGYVSLTPIGLDQVAHGMEEELRYMEELSLYSKCSHV